MKRKGRTTTNKTKGNKLPTLWYSSIRTATSNLYFNCSK